MQKRISYTVAAATACVGSGSLLLFVSFLWTGGFELCGLGMAGYGVLIWDAALCVVFFLQHSIMIRRGFRTWLGGIIPVPWHGVLYTLASGTALLLLIICWQPSHIDIAAVGGSGAGLIRGVFFLSLAGVVWGLSALRNFDPFGTGLLLAHIHSRQTHAGTLTIAGPCRWLRHPVYSFGIVAIWACPVLTTDRLVFDALFTGWIILGCMLEERDLTAQFGDTYERYRTTVPMLLPWPSRFRSARFRSSGGVGREIGKPAADLQRIHHRRQSHCG